MRRLRESFELALVLSLACARPSSPSPPEPVSSATASPPALIDAGSSPVADDVAVPPPDPRPRALARLVEREEGDAGYAAPTGVVPNCEDQLTKAGVQFRAARLAVHTEHKSVCGARQVVTYLKGPGEIAYDPPPLLTCAMALALASFERIVQEEANRVLGSPVVRIDQLGTYVCREIVAVKGLASEHSFANAIDLSRFKLRNGKVISVWNDFDLGQAPAKPAGAFLRAVSERAHYEDVFSNVLTPFWDPAHKNHFHLDLARYRVNGVRRRR